MVDHASSCGGPAAGDATDIGSTLAQQRIESTLRQILKLDRKEAIGGIPMGELGLSSMGALTLQYQFSTEFGADLKISEILEARSIEQLARTMLSRSTCRKPDVGATGMGGVLI